jgi:hypothetical protein
MGHPWEGPPETPPSASSSCSGKKEDDEEEENEKAEAARAEASAGNATATGSGTTYQYDDGSTLTQHDNGRVTATDVDGKDHQTWERIGDGTAEKPYGYVPGTRPDGTRGELFYDKPSDIQFQNDRNIMETLSKSPDLVKDPPGVPPGTTYRELQMFYEDSKTGVDRLWTDPGETGVKPDPGPYPDVPDPNANIG